jgi:hypothetical protein
MALPSPAEFGAVKVRAEWDALPVPAMREILRRLFDTIRIGKPVHTLTRWSSAFRSSTRPPSTSQTGCIWLSTVQPRIPVTPSSRSPIAKP